MNDARVHDNYIFDNWRDGAMLFAVPDIAHHGGGAEGDIFPGISVRVRRPTGSPRRAATSSSATAWAGRRTASATRDVIDMFGNVHAHDDAKPKKPNGNDFWWSEFFAQNTGNCWYGNTGYDGTAATVTGPGEAGRLPASRPRCCRRTAPPAWATTTSPKIVYLLDCANGPDEDTGPQDRDWWTLPAKPGKTTAHGTLLSGAVAAQVEESPAVEALRKRVAELVP